MFLSKIILKWMYEVHTIELISWLFQPPTTHLHLLQSWWVFSKAAPLIILIPKLRKVRITRFIPELIPFRPNFLTSVKLVEPNFLSRRPSNLTQTSYQSPQRHLARAEEGESSQHQSQNIGTETKSCADKCSFCIDVSWVWKLISLKIVQKFNEKVLIPLYGSGSPWPSYYGLVSSAQFLNFPQNWDQKIFPDFFFDLPFTTVFCRRQVSDCVSSIFKLGGKVGNQVFDLRQLIKFPFLILAGQVS